jgi:hypothetical protein
VEGWREYHVTHSCESVRDERHSEVGIVLSGSAGPIPILEDPSFDFCRFGSADLDLHMSCGKKTPARPN